MMNDILEKLTKHRIDMNIINCDDGTVCIVFEKENFRYQQHIDIVHAYSMKLDYIINTYLDDFISGYKRIRIDVWRDYDD